MSSPYIGEIRMFAGPFAPEGWALCDGSLLPIQDFTALYQLIGTVYGGDGQTSFTLPNLNGLSPLHMSPNFPLAQRGSTGPVHSDAAASNGTPAGVVPFNFIISLVGLYPTPDGGMVDAFVGEGRIFSFGFAPQGWAQCNGQSQAINTNQPLFRILGTTYGGDGKTSFGLPNLQGALPVESKTNSPGGGGTASGGFGFLSLNLCIALQGLFPPRSK